MEPDSLLIAQMVAEKISEIKPDTMDLIKTVFTFLNPIILTFGTILLNWYLKKRDKKLETNLNNNLDVKMKILTERTIENEKTNNQMERNFNEKFNKILKTIEENKESQNQKLDKINEMMMLHLNEDNFRKEYRKKIIGKSYDNINNPLLGLPYKSAIVFWSKLIQEFGMNYYYSDVRKKSDYDRKKHLYQRRDEILKEFTEYIDEEFQHTISFSDFLKKYQVFASFEILIDELARNGWSDDELIQKFENQINRFSDAIITASVVWEKELQKHSRSPKIDYND